jgi:acetyl esterase/lipase
MELTGQQTLSETMQQTWDADLARTYRDKRFRVRVTEDVPYAMVAIGYRGAGSPISHRALQLDVYEPIDDGKVQRPALILACGGAFSRGDRKNDEVPNGAARNTPTSEYCREFARRGYVCFSIDYRLMQEMPHPGFTPTLPRGYEMNADRINFVREQMGLDPCTPQMMTEEFEAATDDVVLAATFVRSRAFDYRIDIDRVAIGGFSAGATVALNATFAERLPVAAVVSLSGRIADPVARRCISGAAHEPPILLLVGENDLPAQLESIKVAAKHLKEVGARHEILIVPGANHFYPRTSRIDKAGVLELDVESAIAEFLFESMPSQVLD